MSIESTVIGAVETVVPSPLAAFRWLKIGTAAIAVLVACYLIYRMVSFVEQAAADHAAVQVVTAQLATATRVNADNLKAAKDAAEQHEAVITAANAAAAAARTRAARLAADLETLRHAPHPTTCRPDPVAVGPLLQRLR